jgi:hypothetical protein
MTTKQQQKVAVTYDINIILKLVVCILADWSQMIFALKQCNKMCVTRALGVLN